MRRPLNILIGALLLGALPAVAAERSLFVGASMLSLNPLRFSNSASGGTNLFTSVYGNVNLAYRYVLRDWTLVPSLAFSLKAPPMAEGQSTRAILAGVSLSKAFGSVEAGRLDWKVGGGLLFYSVSTQAETVQLANGGNMSNFYRVNHTSVSRQLFLSAGFGHQLGAFRFDFDTLVTGAFSSSRAFNLLFQMSYGII